MPELTYKTDGFIGSDTLTEEPVLSCNTDMTVVGKFTITVSGGAASSNYTLEYKNGTLTVTNRWIVTMLWRYKGSPEVEYSLTAPDAATFLMRFCK